MKWLFARFKDLSDKSSVKDAKMLSLKWLSLKSRISSLFNFDDHFSKPTTKMCFNIGAVSGFAKKKTYRKV